MDDVVMALLVLGASALAITLMVVLNLLVGGWAPARLKTSDDAARALADGVYGFRPGATPSLDADGAGALALEAGGARLGLVLAMGDRVTVRALRPGEIKAVHRDGARLTLKLNDYTLPAARLRFAAAEEAQRWEAEARAFACESQSTLQDEPSHA